MTSNHLQIGIRRHRWIDGQTQSDAYEPTCKMHRWAQKSSVMISIIKVNILQFITHDERLPINHVTPKLTTLHQNWLCLTHPPWKKFSQDLDWFSWAKNEKINVIWGNIRVNKHLSFRINSKYCSNFKNRINQHIAKIAKYILNIGCSLAKFRCLQFWTIDSPFPLRFDANFQN